MPRSRNCKQYPINQLGGVDLKTVRYPYSDVQTELCFYLSGVDHRSSRFARKLLSVAHKAINVQTKVIYKSNAFKAARYTVLYLISLLKTKSMAALKIPSLETNFLARRPH
jgi:hypothetical protein